MKTKKTENRMRRIYGAADKPRGLCGARRVAMLLLMTMLTSVGAWVQATIGGITYDNDSGYYIMDEAQDFEDLAVYVNGSGTYSTGGDAETTAHNCMNLTFKMTGPVQFGDGTGTGDANHTPISSDWDHQFRGTFDGQDNTISGLIVSTSGNVGLFGCSYGIIKNVTIDKSSITSTNGDAYSGAGAIVGYIGNSGSGVTNCHVKSTVTVSGAKVGGIAGSTSNQIVGFSCAANVIGTDYVGGISGRGYTIKDCIYTGSSLIGGTNMGTITGELSYNCTITNCFTTNPMESVGSGVNGNFLYASAPASGLYYTVTISGVTGYANCIVSNLYDLMVRTTRSIVKKWMDIGIHAGMLCMVLPWQTMPTIQPYSMNLTAAYAM